MRLLKLIGSDPWAHGWQLLHQSPCLYIIFPYPLRCSRFGPLFYIGETTSFRRRMVEHLLRLIAQDGATQQPFYQVVRHNCCQGTQLLAALSFLMMLPVHLAPVDTGERLLAETALCHSLGTLNPPTVYSLLPKTKQRQVQGLRIFDSFRSLCRLRPSQPAAGEMSLSSSVGLIRKEWRDGLQKIAAALAGRRFEKSNAAALAAWNLSPGAWAYVARRVDQFETGWRRKRGLHLLGIISKKRRDLCPFVSSVAVSVPWMGSTSALRILRGEIRELLSAWRRKGHWVPIARHAKCFVSWTAPPTLADCLSVSVRLCACKILAGLSLLLTAVSTSPPPRVWCLGLNSYGISLGGQQASASRLVLRMWFLQFGRLFGGFVIDAVFRFRTPVQWKQCSAAVPPCGPCLSKTVESQ